MGRRRKRRGVSFGTILMLVLSIAVAGCTAYVLPRLAGDTVIELQAGEMLQALSVSDGMPSLMLHDIPISVTSQKPQTVQPTAAVQHTAQSASTPAVQRPTTTPVPIPTAEPYRGGSITLTIGGSIHMDEAVRKSGYYSEADKYDFSELLMLIEDEFASDLTLVSLENLIMPDKKVSALIAPEETLDMLKAAGIDIIAAGFPQAFDQKLPGVEQTVAEIRARELQVIGVAADSSGSAGYLAEINHVKIGFLHYVQSLSSSGKKAIKKVDASYAVPVLDMEKAAADIAQLRSRGAQIVVVSVNWDGSKTTPSKTQVALSQQLADAGADVIAGTGTDIVQPAVWLNGTRNDGTAHKTLCAYSLGSFLSESRSNGGVAAMLLQLKISVDGAGQVSFDQAAYTPTYIWRYKQDGKYFYRVVASDQPSPDGMGDEQSEVKERALANLKKYMGDETVLTIRVK